MDTVVRPLIGWPLFALPDEAGRLDYPTLEDSVRQLIRVVLSTRPGEQLMRPDFGGGLDTQLHQPNTPATRRRIQDLVRDAAAAALGYRTLRFDYAQIVHDWPSVQAAIIAALR